jgi:hypothetical protein
MAKPRSNVCHNCKK